MMETSGQVARTVWRPARSEIYLLNQQLLIPDSPTFLIFNMVYRALFNHIEIIINNPQLSPSFAIPSYQN